MTGPTFLTTLDSFSQLQIQVQIASFISHLSQMSELDTCSTLIQVTQQKLSLTLSKAVVYLTDSPR